MSNYHRYTNGSPMSNWGHAMFAKGNAFRVSHYGTRHYIFRPDDDTPHISTLLKKIKERIMKDVEQGWSIYVGGSEFDQLDITADNIDDMIAGYNPENIVNSAEAWDCYYFVAIAWEIMEDMDIYAILLDDGAIVFDESLCEEVEWIESSQTVKNKSKTYAYVKQAGGDESPVGDQKKFASLQEGIKYFESLGWQHESTTGDYARMLFFADHEGDEAMQLFDDDVPDGIVVIGPDSLALRWPW